MTNIDPRKIRDKDVRELVKKLIKQDFQAAFAPGRDNVHIVVRKNGVKVTTIPSTASDHRSLKNTLAQLARAGYVK